MNASSAHFGAEQARRSVDTYIAAWNEPVAEERERKIAQVMTDDGTYVDPDRELDSPGDLVAHIGQALNAHPGRRIVRTSEVDLHHGFCRFNWRLVRADGRQAPESVDFVEFADDGRIRRVTGFFGPLTPTDG